MVQECVCNSSRVDDGIYNHAIVNISDKHIVGRHWDIDIMDSGHRQFVRAFVFFRSYVYFIRFACVQRVSNKLYTLSTTSTNNEYIQIILIYGRCYRNSCIFYHDTCNFLPRLKINLFRCNKLGKHFVRCRISTHTLFSHTNRPFSILLMFLVISQIYVIFRQMSPW